MCVAARVCSCLARSLRTLYLGLRHQSNVGVCSGDRVMDVPEGGRGVLSLSIELPPPATPVGASNFSKCEQFIDVLGCFVYSLVDQTVV